MNRSAFAACLPLVIGLLAFFTTVGHAEPKEDETKPPKQLGDIYVILKADLYEVDDAFHQKLANAKWRSMADLNELERKVQAPPLTFDKQRLVRAGKKANIKLGDEEVLLTSTRQITCLPSPEQRKQGKDDGQTFNEGVTLRARVQVTPDRRFVRVNLVEKSLEVEGTEKVQVFDKQEKEVEAEIVSLKENTLSMVRYIPDGGALLVPLQYRPRSISDKNRWLVAVLEPRIYIEEEEREKRRQALRRFLRRFLPREPAAEL